MRIACIGAGPGGLMLALLLRRTGGHQVDVFERSPRGATYGFGVVFSRLSLARLRRAVPDVVASLLSEGARWDDVEVRRAGHRARSSGHGYAAVERKTLLATLARLAEEAGAVLHFDTEADADDLLGQYDVVVAGDGAGSRTRTVHADAFGAHVTTGGGRYAWFGVDRAFDAMTFLFADSAAGPLGAHVYPYAKDRSTFLVELGEQTWRAAKLTDGHARGPGWNDRHAMEFCAAVFAEDLAGARLLGNGSRWLSFPRISTERWSAGRLVGIGDAVHTAHFSVGSGTTMALEDAVELARRLSAPGTDTEAACAAYEAARRPAVEAVQQAAWASVRMWEHPQDHQDLDAETLMLRLLSRTGQSPADLLLRLDPGLAHAAVRPLTALPDAPVPALVRHGPCRRPGDALLVEAGGPLPPAGQSGPLLVEVPAADPAAAARCLEDLRAQRPGVSVGVLLRAPAPAEEPVSRAVEGLTGLARTVPLDIVAVAPGAGAPAANRAAQMAVTERVRAACPGRLTTAYVCDERDLSQGWTHVQAGRADAVWTITA
ncbi:FAD-dependent monooxygenase [Streptomyces lasiicapitis]|uniref:FAD-dependent monooxygenase n=1 Tax=Streptomyces lasiicapitis TaxID=1923961 RepID=UPI0036BB25CA